MGAPWWIDRRLSYRIRPVKNRREHGLLVWKHTPSERKRERRLSRRYTHDRRFDVINHTRLVWATHFGVYHQCVYRLWLLLLLPAVFFLSFPPTTRIKGVPTILCIFVLLSFSSEFRDKNKSHESIRPPVFYVQQHRHVTYNWSFG
jgi:hypothetical protein